jgi:cell wall-associated NlpC family hydrolase
VPSDKKIKVAQVTKKVSTKTYKVEEGDNLTYIAKKYHTTISKLLELNDITPNTVLKLGQAIKVPSDKNIHTPVRYAHNTQQNVKKIAQVVHKKTHKKLSKVLKKGISKFTVNDIVFTSRYATAPKATKIIQTAKNKLGKRYVWGATGSNAFDCSGLTTYVCKLNGIKLPRRAIAQSKVGKYVSRKDLKPGDLIFFDTSKHRRGYVNHVGIYIGNNKFIHASSAKHKVTITSLNTPFYSQRFKVARRVIQ